VRERPALPHVSMEPEAPIHGVHHPFAARAEFSKRRLVQRSLEIARRGWTLHAARCLTREGEPRREGAAQLQAIEPSTVAGATAVTDP
jgi:hypothetical protein